MASFSIPTSLSFLLSVSFAFLLLMTPSSEGRDYLVGGAPNSWTLPRPSPESLSHWAHKRQFRVGDALSWKYDHKSESVLEVKEGDYKSCSIANPISKYNDGDTKVELNRTGSLYFISGEQGHCQQGLRLDLVVHSGRHGGNGHGSPSPSPSPSHAPPVPSPSPAPAPSPRGEAPAPKKNGGSALGGGGFLGLVAGIGVTSLVMII